MVLAPGFLDSHSHFDQGLKDQPSAKAAITQGITTILGTAVLLGESLLGESGEKLVTLVGSLLVCFAHFRNYQACKNLECSSCHD